MTLVVGRLPVGRRAGHDRGEVEPEPVDVVLGDPVLEAVHDELPHHGVVAVERVAAAGVVVKLALRSDHVVSAVVEAAEREREAALVTLGGVVEHHVEDDLDAVPVALLDQGLELFVRRPAAVVPRGLGVQLLRGEEVDGGVPPEVVPHLARHRVRCCGVLELVELVHGEELEGVEPHALEVGELGDDIVVGPATLLRGEAADV
mmetsp:Transcript_11111/g.31073  ORF Transcript_11111/g.31073 Transcript_11111/m.31073 type:complete len:204 (+) Transcript_11111:1233-1844(+)